MGNVAVSFLLLYYIMQNGQFGNGNCGCGTGYYGFQRDGTGTDFV